MDLCYRPVHSVQALVTGRLCEHVDIYALISGTFSVQHWNLLSSVCQYFSLCCFSCVIIIIIII